MTSFSTSGGTDNIDHSVMYGPSNGYGDFSDTETVSQFQTLEIEFNASFSTSYMGSRIWVDWNQDGEFSDDEIVYQSTTPSGSVSSTFQVPEDAVAGITIMRVGVAYALASGPENPCMDDEDSSVSFQDFSFEVLALEDCEGTPDAGTVETDLLICANADIQLTAEGASSPAAGLTRVWQSSPAGENDWTDIENSDFSNFVLIGGVEEPTDFRFKLQCGDGDIVYSDVIETTLKAAEDCYCIPGSSTTYYINGFSTTDGEDNIDHNISTAPTSGYGDFTDTQKVSQYIGQTIDFDVSASTNSLGYRIWVDWNKDGQFSANEVVYQSPAYIPSASGTIEVPEGAAIGNTIIRVGIHHLGTTGPTDPCMVDQNTSFQDFTFEVLASDGCEGMPTAGTPVENSISICPEDAFTLEIENASEPANGLYRRWQSSPAGEDNWTDMEDAYTASFTVAEGITEATDYRYAVTCNDEDSDYSDTIEVTLSPANQCFCIPTSSSNYSNEILNFTLNNFSNDSDPAESSNSYSDYTDLGPIVLIPGVAYEASITSGTGVGSHGAAIWIDYNDDGVFSPDEKVAYIPNIIQPNTTIEFPEFVAENIPGEHRLRVQYSYYQSGLDLDPCVFYNPGGSMANGETEDYIVLIDNPECFPPINTTFDYITDNSAQVIWEANGESEWKVIYGPQGFDPETEGETVTVSEPLANLTDLDVDTTYDVYVQTLCDDENSMVMGPHSFTTNVTPPANTRLCDAIELIPNNGCIGGTFTNVNAFAELNEPVGSCLNNFHGNNSVWFTFVATNTEALITTDFNSTNFPTEIVIYEAPADCTDLSTIGDEVGCANSNTSGILNLDGLTIGNTYYIQITGFSNNAGDFCLEVQMDAAEGCLNPTDITIGEIEDTQVDVSWNSIGDATQWEVLYGLDGFDIETEGDSMVVNSTEITITNLEPETDYEVYVRAICGDNNSDWAGPQAFTTKEMGVENQIFEGFSFYPNPVKEMLNLKAGSLIEKVEIHNLLGQKVLEIQPNNLESSIETDLLQTGTYLMSVTIEGVNKTFRLIKK